MLGDDGRAAAALGPRLLRVVADDGDPTQVRPGQGEDAVVGEQHAALDRGAAREGRPVQLGDGEGGGGAEGTHAVGEQQQPPDVEVDRGLGHLTGAHRGQQLLAPDPGRRHLEVLPRRRGVRRAHCGPVAHHHPVEAPPAPQRVLEQLVLGHGGAVDTVVRTHHRPGARLDGPLERGEVHLVQGPLVHVDVHGEAVGLEVIGDIVLRRGGDAVLLEPAHIARGQVTGQGRVLAEALEVAPAQR